MKKILMVGDIHFRSKKLQDIAVAWQRLVSWASSSGVDLIIQAGDVFDHSNVYGREASTGTIYDAFIGPFKKISSKIRLFAIPGNHDTSGPRDKDALAPIDTYEWITVSRNIQVVDFFDDLSVCSIPWINKANLVSKLVSSGMTVAAAKQMVNDGLSQALASVRASMEASKANGRLCIVAGHMEVTGASLGHGQVQADGTFEFSPAELANLGADAYGLAHIHIRQGVEGLPGPNDGYLGTLCQLSFGEAGNATGCRLIEYDGRRIVSDKFLDNKKSPQYHVVLSVADKTWADGDYVKLRGSVRPATLPDGVIFEKLPSAQEARRRTVEILDADTPMEKLLEAWRSEKGCKIETKDLLSAVLCLDKGESRLDPIGSLDRIDRILLENVTCHVRTEVDLSGVSGVCSIEGPNGVGKTSLIEAIPMALYGETPSRPKVDDIMSKGESAAVVELDFESGGRKYRARRDMKRGAKSSQKAFLGVPGMDEPIAGPKGDDVNSSCSGLVGDMGMLLAGVFASQSESGNIIDLAPGDRKELFARLLGTDKLLFLGDSARRIAAGADASCEACSAQLEPLLVELSGEKADVEALGVATATKEDAEKKAKATMEAMSSAQEALNAALSRSVEKSDLVRRASELAGQRDAVRADGKLTKTRRDSVASMNIAGIEARKQRHDEATRKLSEARTALSEKVQSSMSIREKASEAKAKATSIFFDRENKRTEKLKELRRKLEEKTLKMNGELAAVVSEHQAVSDVVSSLSASLEQASSLAGMLDGFPDVDACKSCKFASSGLAARESAVKLRERLAAASLSLSSVAKKVEAKRGEIQAMTSKAKVIEDEIMSPSFMAVAVEEAEAIEASVKALTNEARAMEPTQEMHDLVSRLAAEVDGAADLEKEYQQALVAKDEIARLDGRLAELRKQFLDLSARADEAARLVPQVDDGSIAASTAVVAAAEAALNEANHAVAAKAQEVGRLRQRVDSYAAKKESLARLESTIAEAKKTKLVHSALAVALGRDGIPQLIVDGMLPHFQDLMAEFMGEFDDKWSVRVVSQKMNKTNSGFQERIDIVVDDGSGDRDISTFSGGERKLLKNIIRIAFAVLQAERSGKGLKVLVLDEATDAMDESNADSFVRMLCKLRKYFNQIFVISHNDRVLSSLPSRIFFKKEGSGVSVTSCIQ